MPKHITPKPAPARRTTKAEAVATTVAYDLDARRRQQDKDAERDAYRRADLAAKAARERRYFLGSAALAAQRSLMVPGRSPETVAKLAFQYARAMVAEYDSVRA